MSTYAQTDFIIECENMTQAKKVAAEIKKMKKESDADGNFLNIRVETVTCNFVYGRNSSKRDVNLEWQCEEIWKKIKGMKGVVEANFPFMIEAEGPYFCREDEE